MEVMSDQIFRSIVEFYVSKIEYKQKIKNFIFLIQIEVCEIKILSITNQNI